MFVQIFHHDGLELGVHLTVFEHLLQNSAVTSKLIAIVAVFHHSREDELYELHFLEIMHLLVVG